MKFEPDQYHADPMVNAVLNVAAALRALAQSTDGLLYGLKYSKGDGMSVAEAIEVAGKAQAEALREGLTDIGNSLTDVNQTMTEFVVFQLNSAEQDE